MFEKIYIFFLRKKLLKKYYNEQAEMIMREFLEKRKNYMGIYDKKGNIKSIKKLEVI